MSFQQPRASAHTETEPAGRGGPWQEEPSLGRHSLGPRAFWGLFIAAWLAYIGLVSMVLIGEGRPVSDVLLVAVPMVGAYALPAAVLAWRRRDLLRPERSIVRTLGLHVVVGLGYSLVAATLTLALFGGREPLGNAAGMELFFTRVVSGLFLYAVLAGFLMWSESLARVEESRALAAREAVLRARAEAKALRAQFNPHFVFNTLHSLMLLVRADPPAAEKAIEDVAELIRYASVLQREGVDAVPVVKELEVARRYLALEKLRLEDRLAVEWEVAEEAGRRTLPPFSLQTLLENAIKHGIAPLPEGGNVRVTLALRDDDLLVTVADDGEGAEPETVRNAEGRGLDLVRRRLETLYGPSAGVDWETTPGRGFRVTLRVPPVEPRGRVGRLPGGSDGASAERARMAEIGRASGSG